VPDATRAAIQAAFRVPDEDLGLHLQYSTHLARAQFMARLEQSPRRAAQALRQHLSPFQKEEAARTGYIPVVGSKGGRWLVQLHPQGNQMWKLHDGAERARHRCLVFLDDSMPQLDWVISKVLLLEADERIVDHTAM